MTKKAFTIAIHVSLAALCLPLACGDDPTPNGDGADSGGSGPDATGGNTEGGSMGGDGAGETGGRATGGIRNATGGNGGASGASGGSATGGTSVAGAGGAPGGAAGTSGNGAAGQGGFGGASDGGAGGEGGVDEETAHCERICTKVDDLMCENWSGCVEYYCDVIAYLYYPYCRPYGLALVKCLDERATPDEFDCWYGHAAPKYIPGKSSCAPEIEAAMDVGCL